MPSSWEIVTKSFRIVWNRYDRVDKRSRVYDDGMLDEEETKVEVVGRMELLISVRGLPQTRPVT